MAHAYNEVSATEAMYGMLRLREEEARLQERKALQAERESALLINLQVMDANLDATKSDPTLWRAFRREMRDAHAPITEEAAEIYANAATKLINAKHSHLTTHKRSPLLPFRHRDHWTGWAIRFRHPKPDEVDATGPLAWDVTHITARPEATDRGARYYDGDRLRGHIEVSKLVAGHGVLNLVCDCGHKYYDEIPLYVVMRDAARDLNRDTPLNADGRIYLRLPL